MYLAYYDEQENRHKHALTTKNPVSMMFRPAVAKKVCEDFAKAMGLEIISDDNKSVDNSPHFEQVEVSDELPW